MLGSRMSRWFAASIVAAAAVGFAMVAVGALPQRPSEELEPFVGVTADGEVVSDLYEIRATGVSTRPVAEAAEVFLASLTEAQRADTTFGVDSDEWRLWHNIHRYDRAGISRAEMNEEQEAAAMGLLRATLSAEGFAKARDIMRLNGYLGAITGRTDEYGEGMYHFTVMGEPSDSEPWGWQLDGHHLVINTFVLGDQMVMTPTFMGSEPVAGDTERWGPLRVFEPEERRALAFVHSLDEAQRSAAVVADELPRNVFTAAFHDNEVMAPQGLLLEGLTDAQHARLVELLEAYVGNLREGHSEAWMQQVLDHLHETRFAWMGGTGEQDVFYYRIQSPVILIEFDHQGGIALDTDGVTRDHVHSVTRTPNGNDYGRDLLRQHHERYAHVNGRHVRRPANVASSEAASPGADSRR